MIEAMRFGICALLMALGLFFELSAVIGVFRFRGALTRMHAAALGDTMGIFLLLLGLVVANGLDMLTLKILLLIPLFWTTSPVSSHLIGKLELITNEEVEREVSLGRP